MLNEKKGSSWIEIHKSMWFFYCLIVLSTPIEMVFSSLNLSSAMCCVHVRVRAATIVINLVFHLKRGHCSAETRSRIIMSLTCKQGIVRLSGSISIRRGIAVIRVTSSITGGYLPSIQSDLWILREVGC